MVFPFFFVLFSGKERKFFSVRAHFRFSEHVPYKAAYSRYCEGVRAEIALEYPSDPEVLLGSTYRVVHLSGISVGAHRLGPALMANFLEKKSLQENMWPLNQKNRLKEHYNK